MCDCFNGFVETELYGEKAYKRCPNNCKIAPLEYMPYGHCIYCGEEMRKLTEEENKRKAPGAVGMFCSTHNLVYI